MKTILPKLISVSAIGVTIANLVNIAYLHNAGAGARGYFSRSTSTVLMWATAVFSCFAAMAWVYMVFIESD